MKLIFFFICILPVVYSQLAYAQKNSGHTLLAVGQGISAPTITSPINYGHGFTANNAAVARLYDDPQLSLQYHTNDNENSGMGAELGLGNGQVGLGLGYYKNDCNNCEGRLGAIAGFALGRSASIGVGYREDDLYSLGLLMNSSSQLQFGIAVDFKDNGDSRTNTYSFGLGAAYLAKNVIFSVDASKREDKDESTDNSPIMLTPGLLLDAGAIRLAVSHDMYVNDKNNIYDDKTWFGVGFGKQTDWTLNLYKDYTAEYSAVLSIRF